ncbi:hypothetical protein TNCV_434011 [Trichonephila clavipes]|nr:hypothetical protein TNCV_434011 [Trichonephila clavipes]
MKKDSVEDFVLLKKTARPVSPSVSEPVAIINSFSDLKSEEIKTQVETVEVKTAEHPKPKPPNAIHLKIKEIFRHDLSKFIKISQILQIKPQENLLNFLLKMIINTII